MKKKLIIGFCIISPMEFKRYIQRYIPFEQQQDTRASYSKSHCAVVKNSGFDEYYLLDVAVVWEILGVIFQYRSRVRKSYAELICKYRRLF